MEAMVQLTAASGKAARLSGHPTPRQVRNAGRPVNIDTEMRRLLLRLHHALPAMKALLERCQSHWTYEDGIYRFYHGSYKVYALQQSTLEIVAALKHLARDGKLNGDFLRIVREGTGKTFKMSDNARWLVRTRPIVEAYLHALYFLEMGVRYGQKLKSPPQILPSGWAAFLTLYDLR